MKIHGSILTVLALGILAPITAQAAPLRTLVYHFSYDARTFGSDPSAGGGTVSENGSFGTASRAGKLTVDVIQATADGGLVVDVTEMVDRADRPMQKVRCAIYGKSVDVICDQGIGATDEQETLLSYLGRLFYTPSLLDDKGHWHTTSIITGAVLVNDDFTVKKTDGDLLTIGIDRTRKGGGVEDTITGSLVYNAAMVAPVSVHQEMTSQGSSEQGDQNVDLQLLSDSMAQSSSTNSH